MNSLWYSQGHSLPSWSFWDGQSLSPLAFQQSLHLALNLHPVLVIQLENLREKPGISANSNIQLLANQALLDSLISLIRLVLIY